MTRITVIGLGLIGGSIAKELRSQINVHVVGVDLNEAHAVKAKELGLVDEIKNLEEGIKDADVIIIAIPVNYIEDVLPQVLDQIHSTAVVIDVGSTKAQICNTVSSHPNRGRFVSSHPLAGTEFSGPEAALKGLFLNKKNIICEKEKSDPDALALTIKIMNSLGMENYFMGADDHDKHLAYVSHLSHISSFTLSLTVQDIEKDESQIYNLASTGFESTVRLAKSSPETWSPIFNKNSEHLCTAIDQYIGYLEQFKTAIQSEDGSKTKALMVKANKIKKVLKK